MFAYETAKELRRGAKLLFMEHGEPVEHLMRFADETATKIIASQKFHFGEEREIEHLLPPQHERLALFKYCRMPFSLCWFDGTLDGQKKGYLVTESEDGLISIDAFNGVPAGWPGQYKDIMWEFQSITTHLSLNKPLGAFGKAILAFAQTKELVLINQYTEKEEDESFKPDLNGPGYFAVFKEGSPGFLSESDYLKVAASDADMISNLLLLLNCKNISTTKMEACFHPYRSQPKVKQPFSYHRLIIKLPGKGNRYIPLEALLQHNRLHWRRGHWKVYGENGRKKLFGRYAGLYFWCAHLAGQDAGIVFKDYIVKGGN